VLQATATFDSPGIVYAIGGSFASSIHGIARRTQDLDIIAAISSRRVEAVEAAFRNDFYVDGGMIREALRIGRSFNLKTGFKIDIFPASAHLLGAQQLKRRQDESSEVLGGPAATLPTISPEDTILVKLRWYRDGGEASERQWNDLRNIATVQGQRLEREYLATWSRELNAADLLSRLLSEF
jgi:hypothetical protein